MAHDDGSEAPLAVVVGGGSGIGAATAMRLARRGLCVIITGRTHESLSRTAGSIRAAGGRVEVVVSDCGASDGRAALIDALGDRPVRAYVQAAGQDRIRTFATTTVADFDQLVATNLAAPFFLSQLLLTRFSEQASITFVGSVSAQHGLPRHALYGATKAALRGLTVNLASELAPAVRVNCVSPGGTDTPMLADFVERSREGLTDKEIRRQHVASSARMLLGRVANPDEVAATIEHVALDATAMTGVDVPVDVGYTAS